MEDILGLLVKRGCSVHLVAGAAAKDVAADVAILHVDATRLPEDYLRFASRFPICLNGKVADISKSVVSELSVARPDDWNGPVIVKTQLNYRGTPEAAKNFRARQLSRPAPFPDAAKPRPYEVFRSSSEVPTGAWNDSALIVERFLPEKVQDGFAMCHYVFCGEYEFCGRFVGTDELVKGKNVFRHEIIPVPDRIRKRRNELGFDYGKFDFVHYEGETFLIDANKTPGRIPPSGGASLEGMADGFLGLLKTRG